MRTFAFLLFLLGAAAFVFPANAQTTIILEDGTVIETYENVYTSFDTVYIQVPLTPVARSSDPDGDVGPEQYSPEWCEDWYSDVYDGAPTFPNLDIIDRCNAVGVDGP